MAGRKLRSALTAIAIVLGVAMMSGAYVLTDTIDRAFDEIFVDSYAGTDAVVSGKNADISFEGESATPSPVSEELLERVRSVEGVEVATGSLSDFQTKLLTADGEEIEVAHEALIREWGTLRQWLREDRADLRLRQELRGAAAAWEQGGRAGEYLWRGGRLSQARDMRTRDRIPLSQAERAFVEA